MAEIPWYRRYEEFRERIEQKKLNFESKCEVLAVEPIEVIQRVKPAIIAQAVHESNWQEGVRIDHTRTDFFNELAINNFPDIRGPRINMEDIVEVHQKNVADMMQNGADRDELAAYNLSFAHKAVEWVAQEIAIRQHSALVQSFLPVHKYYHLVRKYLSAKWQQTLDDLFDYLEASVESTHPIEAQYTEEVGTIGNLIAAYTELDMDELLRPMRVEYIHFLHQIAMMGILPTQNLGVFRSGAVYVPNVNISFPNPTEVLGQMEKYCYNFPAFLTPMLHSNKPAARDAILNAAKASYNLVKIHPYENGNGRISRLLMNLVLSQHFPPVPIKANADGRKKYGYALRLGDRGRIEPLACLITLALNSVYDQLLTELELDNAT